MYLGLTILLNGIILCVSLTQLIPQGNWLFLVGLILSTSIVTWAIPRVRPHNGD